MFLILIFTFFPKNKNFKELLSKTNTLYIAKIKKQIFKYDI
jgi:hypothetical protein